MAHVSESSSRTEVLEAVKQDGCELEYASAALKDDREFMLEAVKQNGRALVYASAGLRNHRTPKPKSAPGV